MLYIMASSSYFLFVIGLCVCVTLLNPISCYGHYLIVFGDSLFDVGNNQYVTPDNKPPAYYSPYGMTIDKPTGRFCDGFVVPDFISLFLGVSAPPALEPGANFSHGASFASGGAGVFNNSGNGAMNLRDQFGNFSKMVSDKLWTDEALSEAIYMFSIGGNDYFPFIGSHINDTVVDETEQEQLVQQVLGNYTEVLEAIYNQGARKFVFQNVAPMGCLPTWRYKYNMTDDTCPSFPLQLANLHNKKLKTAVANLSRSLPGFNHTIFDYNKTLMKKISNPFKYGFQVSASACCGNGPFNGADDCGSETISFNLCNCPSNKVFFDSGHHTQHTNEQLAWSIWSGDKDEIAPYNMMELLEIKIKDGKAHKLSYQIANE